MSLDLVVNELTLPDFLEQTAKTQAADIRALTVNIDYDCLVSPFQECQHDNSRSIHDSLTAQTLWTYLRNLARALQHMTALTTFAFIVVRPKCTFWLPRDILTDLVQNLPHQCRNLELDTDSLDRVREEIGVDEHLCKAISRAIPNLQHLRLRLTAMCPALFHAASAPILETVSVNCIGSNPLHGGLQTCRVLPEAPATATDENGQDAAPHIAESLRDLAAASCPRLKLATVTDLTHCNWHDRSTHHCYSIRDALVNKTYALPLVRILWGEGCNMLLRTRDGEEYISDRTTTPPLSRKPSLERNHRRPAITSFFLPRRELSIHREIPPHLNSRRVERAEPKEILPALGERKEDGLSAARCYYFRRFGYSWAAARSYA